MRTLLRFMKTSELDPDAGKSRPEQIMLRDDPTFFPELALPRFDFDISHLDLALSTPISMLPLSYSGNRLHSQRKSDPRSPIGLNDPNSDTGAGSMGGALTLSAADSRSAQGRNNIFSRQPMQEEDEDEGFLPDADFEFDAEGNIRDIGSEMMPVAGAAAAGSDRSPTEEYGRDLNIQLPDLRAQASTYRHMLPNHHLLDDHLDQDIQMGDDYVLPDAEPFPIIPRAHTASDQDGHRHYGSIFRVDEQDLSDSAEAPLQRKRKALKLLEVDADTELRKQDLAAWEENYIRSMKHLAQKRQTHKAPNLAKKNAMFWVLDSGIGGVGIGIGQSRLPGPLKMFWGPSLIASLRLEVDHGPSKKRARSNANDLEYDTGRLRPLQTNKANPREQQIGRGDQAGLEQEDYPAMSDGPGIEVGRNASRELQDFSSIMPWNVNSSLGGSRQGSVASRGAPYMSGALGGLSTTAGGAVQRRPSRLTGSSPLVRHGRYSGLERLSSLEIAGSEGDGDLGNEDLRLGEHGWEGEDDGTLGDFELHAQIDDSGFQERSVLPQNTQEIIDRQSLNFLEFLKAALPLNDQDTENEETTNIDEVSFEKLLPPTESSTLVAAQGFFHVLFLATKSLVTVCQDELDYGEIRMKPIMTHI
ncbi:MAG: phosphomevalonate kinase [Chaenotheca gracillima]|nr:MAG: phosphomevalonate kinase [Chaenotheca gracillima]